MIELSVDELILLWEKLTHQKLKWAMIPLGIDVDKDKPKKQKKRGKLPDKAALARFGIDYDSI